MLKVTGRTLWIDLIIPIWILAITSFSRAKETAIDAYLYQRSQCLRRKTPTVEPFYLRMHLRVRKIWSKWHRQEDATKTIQRTLPSSSGFMNSSAPDSVATSLSVKRGAHSRQTPATLLYMKIKLTRFLAIQNASTE